MGQGEATPEGSLAPAVNPTPANNGVKWHMAEVRIEGSSASALGFSEPCSLCGRRKRRAVQPPTRERKKVLVFEEEPVGRDASGSSKKRSSATKDDECRMETSSVVGNENASVGAAALSGKKVGVPASNLAEREKDKNVDAVSTRAKKADIPYPGGNRRQESLTRDEGITRHTDMTNPGNQKKQHSSTRDEGNEVMVRVNDGRCVVLTGGNLARVKLSVTCKCEGLYEITI